VPTLHAVATSLAATPQPIVDSGLPVETSPPITTPAKPSTTQSKHKQDSTHPSSTTGSHDLENEISSIAPAVKGTKLESADDTMAPVATKTIANGHSAPWDGVAAVVSMFLPKGSRLPNAAEGHGLPPKDPTSAINHGVVISAGSTIHTALSNQGSVFLDGTPLVDGQATIISGQTISAKSGTVFVNSVPQQPSMLEQRPTLRGPSTVAGQGHGGSHQIDTIIQADGENSNLGVVTAVDGSIAAESQGAKDDAAESPNQGKHDTVFTVNGHTYSAESKSGLLYVNDAPASVGDKITINGDVLTIGPYAINFQGTTIAVPYGHPAMATATATAAAGADIVIAQEKVTALKDGVDVLIAGTKLTLGQVTTIAGTRVSVASNGVLVGTRTAVFHDLYSTSDTAAFHEMDGSAANTGTAIILDGTVYSVSTMAGQPDAVLLADQILLVGGTAATINGQVITNGPNGLSIVKPTASATVISATNLAGTLLIIDGTTYTATPIPGKSGAVVLQGQTLFIGGPAVTIANHLITEASNGISVVGSTSLSSNITSKSPSSTEVSQSSTRQESASTPSEESSASVRSHGGGSHVLSFVILLVMFMGL